MFTSKIAIPFLYLFLLVLLFAAGLLVPDIKHRLALLPRHLSHLSGALTTVFVHKNLEHLSSNFLPLAVCLFGIFFFYRGIALKTTLWAHLLTGLLIWIFARPAYHIGASGLVYALVFFTVISGIIRNNRKLRVFALIVLVFQSGLIWGIFPADNEVSWESHLLGAITGLYLALRYRKQGPPPDSKTDWNEELEEEERDRYAEL